MTRDDWDQLRELLDRALDLPVGERSAFLCQVDAEHPHLAQSLRRLVQDAGSTVSQTPFVDFSKLLPQTGRFARGQLLRERFRIEGFLGEGGMGEVYLAEDLLLNRRLALKTIRPEVAASRESLDRFRAEVKLALKVNSPHICRIYDLFRTEVGPPVWFLTMEYLDGETLAARIKREGALEAGFAMSIARQLCDALRALHEAGVVHRDFKPNNVMIVNRSGEERAVAMDMGLALDWSAAAAGGTGITRPGAVMGTPEYMEPQQFLGLPATPTTDIYALGVVLYEMATGNRPFRAATPIGAAALRASTPQPVSKIRTDLSGQWDAVISRCLEYEREARFQSAAEVAEALESKTPVARPRRFNRTQRIAAILVAAALLLTAAAVLVLRLPIFYARPSRAAELWYEPGVAALREGTYFKATQALQRAVQLDPDFALGHARLAEAWNELDFTGKASAEMLKVAQLENRQNLRGADRKYIEAVRATQIFEFKNAVADYEAILRDAPDSDKAWAYVDLGRAQEKAANVDAAEAAYRKAAKLAPESPAAFLHLGIVSSLRGKTAEADAAFNRAESLYRAGSNSEGLAEIAYQRAYAASVRGETQHARDLLDRSIHMVK